MQWQEIRKKFADVVGDTLVITEKYEILSGLPFSVMILVGAIAVFLNYSEIMEAWKHFSSAPLLNSGILFVSVTGIILSKLYFLSEALKLGGIELQWLVSTIQFLPPLIPLIYTFLVVTYFIKFLDKFMKYRKDPENPIHKIHALHALVELLAVIVLTAGLFLGSTPISAIGAVFGLLNALMHEYRNHNLAGYQPVPQSDASSTFSAPNSRAEPLSKTSSYENLFPENGKKGASKNPSITTCSSAIFHPAAMVDDGTKLQPSEYEPANNHPASIIEPSVESVIGSTGYSATI